MGVVRSIIDHGKSYTLIVDAYEEYKKICEEYQNSVCEQGVLSFHLNYNMEASICSNLKNSIPYTTLPEVWESLKKFNCEIRDSKKPSIFLKN